MRFITVIFLVIILLINSYNHADICGKVDIGPALIHMDVLESGKTVHSMDVKAIKADATIGIYQGICLKPGFLIGWGGGKVTSGTIGIGHYTPLTDKIALIPTIGVSHTRLHTHFDREIPLIPTGPFKIKEQFRATSTFVGLEFCYKLMAKLTLMGQFQYAWSRSNTTLTNDPLELHSSSTSYSSGPNYALGIDYSINEKWSLTFGAAYNISLSKEKHGLRARGVKLGIAYYF